MDWFYLGRHTSSTIHTDELNPQRLDQNKLLRYASELDRSDKKALEKRRLEKRSSDRRGDVSVLLSRHEPIQIPRR